MGLNYESQKGKTLFVKEKGKTHQIKIEDITHIECISSICSIFHTNGIISVYKSLKEYEKLTLPYYFFKVNRNTIVNLNHMTYYDSKNNDSYIMLDKKKITVSRRKRPEFNAILSI